MTCTTSNSPPGAKNVEVEDENLIDAFGMDDKTLAMYLIRASLKRPLPHIRILPNSLSPKLIAASCPEIDLGINQEVLEEVLSKIPSQAEAERLCNLYLEYGRFLYTPIHRKELQEEVLDVVYKPEGHDSLQVHHAISLLFIIIAIGLLFDPTRPPYSDDAHEYFLLSRAALNLSPPTIHTTLNAILTLMHTSQYLDMRDWESIGSNQAWIYVGFAFRLAYTVGLHLNSSRWHLCDEASERRSRIFWQLFSLDTWMSFSFGRPPSTFLPYIDCEFPKDIEAVTNSEGEPEMGFHPWTYRYTALLQSVISTAFVPKPPPYTTILELDKKIRDFPVPMHLRPKCRVVNQVDAPMLDIQRWFVLIAKETTLLNLHRGYFAQALQEQPSDLLKHRYGPSMLATYRSAWRIIETVVISWKDNPLIMSRITLAWSQTLSAAIVMCLLATRAPSSRLTSSALEELDRALTVYEEAAATCRSASANLDAMRTLRNKAYATVNRTNLHESSSSSLTPDELDRLGGKTHLIIPPMTKPSPPSSFSAIPSPVTLTENNMDLLFDGANLHPTIAHDLRTLDSGETPHNQMMDYPPGGVSTGLPGLSGDGELGSQSMQDVQFLDSLFGVAGPGIGWNNSLLSSGVMPSGGVGYHNGYSNLQGSYSPPTFGGQMPASDAVWQNLVEHLGFQAPQV
ncbi:hypothetical protein ONZ45_g17961 [Pleurotus djamor]|nr:hypothetical protein ONZ45_g17961 [Pleurotus djamor]